MPEIPYTRKQSQVVVNWLLMWILNQRLQSQLIPVKQVYRNCLHDSMAIQDSIFGVGFNQNNSQPQKIIENQQCKPFSFNFKVRKSQITLNYTQKKSTRSKSLAPKCSIQANKNMKSMDTCRQKFMRKTKAFPLKLINQKQRNTIKNKIRYASILNQNVNINEIFKYHSDNLDQKNDAIERMLRERKNKQVPFIQKSVEAISAKKCQTKRIKDQVKKINSVNTDYEGIPVMLCKSISLHIPPSYIQMNINILDQNEEQNEKITEKIIKNKNLNKKQQSLVNIFDYQKLKLTDQNELFSRKFIRYCSFQKTKQSNNDNGNGNDNKENSIIDYQSKLRNMPKKVSFECLLKYKNGQKFYKQSKKPLQKKKKVITFNLKQKNLISTLSRNTVAKTSIQPGTQTHHQNSDKVIVGGQQALNLLINNEQKRKLISLSKKQKYN